MARGTLAECLAAARRMYDAGARGSSASVDLHGADTQENRDLCASFGFVPEAEAKAADAGWRDARYDEVFPALRAGRRHVATLLASPTVEEYRLARAAGR